MVLPPTEEMLKVEKIFSPYIKKGTYFDLVADAPQEAINARRKYFELDKKQTEEEVKSWFE